jgi:hypothetical protein
MAKSKRNIEPHPLVAALQPDPSKPPMKTVKLFGYPGTSSDSNATRLWMDSDLLNYVDVPNSAIQHSVALPDDGGTILWVSPDTQLSTTDAATVGQFLAGSIASRHFGGAARADVSSGPQGPVPEGINLGGPCNSPNMAFVTEKEELKPGLILFRRGDVDHRMWYCRMKMPKADRYKTVSLKTSDKEAARERAFDQDADVRFRIKHDVPVFNRPFRDVAHEYLLTQEARAKRGEISVARPRKLRAVIEGTLDRYAGSTQVHLIGDERWGGYPAWRRENGAGRHRRNGVREVTADAAQSFADHEAERRTKGPSQRTD